MNIDRSFSGKDILNWKATNKGSGYGEISGKNLEKLQQSVRDVKAKRKTVEAHKKTVQELKRIRKISVDDWNKSIKKNIPTEKEIAFSLRPGKGKLFAKDFNESEGGILYVNRAIEDGDIILAEALVRSHVDALKRKMPKPQAAILGCTHYPLLEEVFQDALGKNVQVYSQANLVAESLSDYLKRHPDLSSTNKPKNRFITTGDPAIVSMRASQFLKRSVEFTSA